MDWGSSKVWDGKRRPGNCVVSGTFFVGAMSERRFLMCFVVAAILVGGVACARRPSPESVADPVRIVAMAPSLTETLLALDLEDRVVGVTRYCPPVDGAVVVGGYLDPSFEAIVSLEPDLVLTMQSHNELNQRLGDLGLDTLRVDQHDVEGILTSIETVAARCGFEQRGRELAAELRSAMDLVAAKVEGRSRPRTLVVVGREPGGGRIGGLWVAASDTFYDDVLRLAGGVNAVTTTTIRYPELSREGLLAVDADVVLDVLTDGGVRGIDRAEALADWRSVADLRAVENGRVHILVEDHVVIPGPRIVDTVRTFAELLHPEAEWR